MANNKNVLPNTKRVKIDKLPKEPNIEKQYKDALKLFGDSIKPLEKEQLKKILTLIILGLIKEPTGVNTPIYTRLDAIKILNEMNNNIDDSENQDLQNDYATLKQISEQAKQEITIEGLEDE